MGEINVEVRCSGQGWYWLMIWDDGVGMLIGMDYRKTTSQGLQLVNSFTHQPGGIVVMTKALGTLFVIEFPIPTSSKRRTPTV